MSLISSLAHNIRALTVEDPAQPLQPYSVLMDMLGLTMTDSGLLVNEKTAMRQPTVFACVRVLSQGLSSLPLVTYKRESQYKKTVAAEHRLYPLLHDEPNPQMTSMDWREGTEAQRQLWGNKYTEIQRDRAGRVVALWPMPSDRTNPERVNGKLAYVTVATPDGSKRYIDPQNMIHVPGLAFDGLTGLSPIQFGKNEIGRALAMERFGAQYFGNGVRPSGAFVYTGGVLSDEARENLRKSLQSAASGQNALRPLLLENGLEWKEMKVTNNEAQFVEAMKEAVANIARLFGVPLHLVQELSRATNNNIEQQALEFVMHCLRPNAVKWEQELNRKLFAGSDYYCEHSMEGLLRGDFKTRMEGWATLFQTGAVSPNHIAATEGWNPIDGKDGGDLHFVQMNMIPLKTMAAAPPPPDKGDQGEGTPEDPSTVPDPNAALRRLRVTNACRHIFRDAVNRTISRSKRDQETCTRIWSAPLRSMASLIAMCMTGDGELTAAQEQFVDRCAGVMWQRAAGWKADSAEEITELELGSKYVNLTSEQILGGSQQ